MTLTRRALFSRWLPGQAEAAEKLAAESQTDSWTNRLRTFAESGEQSARLLVLPDYRPDIAVHAATILSARFFDFRSEVMADRAWQAHTIETTELQSALREAATLQRVVAFNVEVLLATKSKEKRAEWLGEYLTASFENPVITVLTLYADEVVGDSPQILRIERDQLPAQKILNRMLELKREKGASPRPHPVTVLR